MSLQYVIDGYNVIKHAAFSLPKNINNDRFGLIFYLSSEGLCGSPKNKVTVVFDGYPQAEEFKGRDYGISVVFSRDVSADESIRKLLQESGNPKNMVVVSDDKEINFFTRLTGATVLRVEDFINARKKKRQTAKEDASLNKLGYSQMSEINKELRKIWLKER